MVIGWSQRKIYLNSTYFAPTTKQRTPPDRSLAPRQISKILEPSCGGEVAAALGRETLDRDRLPTMPCCRQLHCFFPYNFSI